MQVATRHGPDAVVDPQLDESPVGPTVGDDRDRNLHAPTLGVEAEDHFLEAPRLHEHMVNRIERHVVFRKPRAQFADVRLERLHADDPSPPRVVQHRLAGERPGQSRVLPGHQAVVVGHQIEPLQLPLTLQSLPHGGREQLGNPRHGSSVSQTGQGERESTAAGKRPAHLAEMTFRSELAKRPSTPMGAGHNHSCCRSHGKGTSGRVSETGLSAA
jgi:hypothetical protein